MVDELVPLNFLEDTQNSSLPPSKSNSLNSDEELKTKKIHTIMGLVPIKHFLKFEKLIFRISRGNIVLRTKNLQLIDDPFLKNHKMEEKALIFLILPKTEKEVMIQSIQHVLQTMDFKETEFLLSRQKNELVLNLKVSLDENQSVLEKTESEIGDIFK